MALAKRLRDAVERKNAEILPLLQTVDSIHEHMKTGTHHSETPVPPASVEMCVVSVTPFSRGWRCVLTDKDAAEDGFESIQADFDNPSYREQSEFVFRLTLWRGKKHPRRQPNYKPGTILLVKRVTEFKTYHEICQGEADMDEMIKEEDDKARQPQAKKMKTK